MKILHNLLGILCGFALMIILLITSIEAVTYWTPGYYEKEYAKYGVLQDVHMEMNDLLDVTDQMMAYLRGNREDLHVPTVVDGQPREFFNDREIAHMEDVRGLFLGGLALRRISIGLIVVCVVLLFARKADVRRVLPKMICAGSALFFAVLAILAAIISTDFHHIFFNNDLWLLNPDTDLLINIVPEPFFMDTAARIAVTYGVSVLAVFAICLIILYYNDRRGKKTKI